MNLDLLAENATRLGARLQETISERTRDLTSRTGSSLFLDGGDERPRDLRKQLDTGSDREKLDAMKRLIALISKGRNVSEYFAQVVKNVASQNLEVRKLVYIYLLRYAEQEPDLALLSINTFQKDLNDGNPLIRAMALRVLAGVKVPMIASVVVLAVKKCAADPSPYVRKAAAYAVPKVYELDSSHLPELIEILSTLLRDRSPLSIGATAVAFDRVCPTRLDLLHGHYRRLCRTLLDVDEWGQVNLLELLVRYVRTMLARPMSDEGVTDEDLKLLLSSAEPLLMSRNPAVVMTVAKSFYYITTSSELSKVIQPLLRILQASKEIERVVLTTLLVIAQEHSTLFTQHYPIFFIRSTDITAVKELKMRMLVTLVNQDNHQALLREFVDYAEDVDDTLVAHAIRAIGHCAILAPSCAQQCLTALMGFIHAKHEAIVSNAVLVLKYLVQSELRSSSTTPSSTGQSPLSIIAKLAYRIDDIRHPHARACVLWLVGQYATDTTVANGGTAIQGVASWAPDVLRKAAKSFPQEESTAKLQTLTLAAKLLVLSPSSQPLILLFRFVFTLARYDDDYDVRDRARMLGALLAGAVPAIREEDADEPSGVVLRAVQVKKILFEGKDVQEEIWGGRDRFTDSSRMILGSLSAVTGKDMHAGHPMPDWLEQGTDSSLRDTQDDHPPIPVLTSLGSNTSSVPRAITSGSSRLATPVMLSPAPGSPATKGNWTNLDKFYASEEEEETDDDEGDNSGEEDEEEDEEEEVSEEDGENQDNDEESEDEKTRLHLVT